jgi:NADH:ubiquinone oxidoreductase subunit F (NADH-binding)/NADH:ubiquinone oxidoreductase subunit E
MEQPVHFRRRPGRPKGRAVDPVAREAVRRALGDEPLRRDLLIEYLHRLQDAHGALAPAHLVALAEALRLAPAEVYEVATFYHHFDVLADGQDQPAPLTVRICDSLSCLLAGADDLAGALADLPAGEVRVQRVPCVGRCDAAPAVVVGQRPLAPATPAQARAAIAAAGLPDALEAVRCPLPPAAGYAQARASGAYRVLQSLHAGARARDAVCDELERAGLRGMGGAGFPTGRKWRIVAGQPGPRLLVVNADEGEPGTFKDRHFLETDPHAFLEGMLIAAWVAQADACYIYLRDEYAGVRALLERELAAVRAAPPVPAAAMPELHLRRGAGAYICGEESALIESIEGRRGTPRLRPPYVAEVGLFGRPTLVNNVETLVWAQRILAGGAEAFAAHGRQGRRGLRAFSVSGRVREPGVKIAPAGISLRELVDEHCGGMAPGHRLYAYLPGGASGGILPAELADLPLDFDTLQPHGCFIGSAAVIVLSQADRARDAAAAMMRFFRDESCGQCTPCRVGTAKAQALLAAPRWDAALLGELAAAMADASICGLGQAAPNPVLGVLRHFGHEVGAAASGSSP